MTGILIFLVAFVAMLGWFVYVATKDPAGIFKPRPKDRDDELPPGR